MKSPPRGDPPERDPGAAPAARVVEGLPGPALERAQARDDPAAGLHAVGDGVPGRDPVHRSARCAATRRRPCGSPPCARSTPHRDPLAEVGEPEVVARPGGALDRLARRGATGSAPGRAGGTTSRRQRRACGRSGAAPSIVGPLARCANVPAHDPHRPPEVDLLTGLGVRRRRGDLDPSWCPMSRAAGGSAGGRVVDRLAVEQPLVVEVTSPGSQLPGSAIDHLAVRRRPLDRRRRGADHLDGLRRRRPCVRRARRRAARPGRGRRRPTAGPRRGSDRVTAASGASGPRHPSRRQPVRPGRSSPRRRARPGRRRRPRPRRRASCLSCHGGMWVSTSTPTPASAGDRRRLGAGHVDVPAGCRRRRGTPPRPAAGRRPRRARRARRTARCRRCRPAPGRRTRPEAVGLDRVVHPAAR